MNLLQAAQSRGGLIKRGEYMRFKVAFMIILAYFCFSPDLLSCPHPYLESDSLQGLKTRFFTLAPIELRRGELGQKFKIAPSPSQAAEEEMLAGWFDLIDDLPQTQKAKEDLRYLVKETSLDKLYELMDDTLKYNNGESWPPNQTLRGALGYNLAARAIVRSGNLNIISYLVFIRKLDREQIFSLSRDSWDYEAYNANRDDLFNTFTVQAKEAYDKLPPAELKWRYAFQLIRLYFYQKNHQAAIDFFSQDLASLPPNPIREWCRSFYAGSLAAQGKMTAAFKEFALVLHRSAYYGTSARSSLRMVISGVSESAALDMAEGEDEAAIVQSVFSYIAGGSINRLLIARLLTVLTLVERGGEAPYDLENDLALAINQLEEETYGRHVKMNEEDSPIYKEEPELERMILAVAPKRPCPSYWYLAAAHLAIMRKNTIKYQEYMNLALAAGAERYLPKQLALTQLLKSAFWEPLNQANETSIGRQLQALYREGWWRSSPAALFESGIAEGLAVSLRGLMEAVLAPRYHAAGRNDRAFLCLAVSENLVNEDLFSENLINEDLMMDNKRLFFHLKDEYGLYWARPYLGLVLADPLALKGIRRTIERPDKGELEKFLTGYLKGWTPDVLTELIGLAHIYRHEFKVAARELASLETRRKDWSMERYKDKTPGNPFRLSPKDIFGNLWQDDFKNLYKSAEAAGLTRTERQRLEQLTASPLTFFQFADQANRLEELTKGESELSSTAAYFYAMALYNIYNFRYWDQSCYYCYPNAYGESWAESYKKSYPSFYKVAIRNDEDFPGLAFWGNTLKPDPIETEITPLLRKAAKTKNPELAARANFLLAGLGRINAYSWNNKTWTWDYDGPEKFMPYYRALNNYSDTAFVKAINFNCPEAKNFLKSAIAAVGQGEAIRLPQ